MPDIIAAVATGTRQSAIGVIRISGEGAIEAADRVFKPVSGAPMSRRRDRELVYGKLHGEDGEVVDVCLCSVSRGPRSYTGEDSAELQCHGSPLILRLAMELLFAAGARQALPGEFTKRAFLNGKLDLTGAEAVVDLIEAETVQAAKNAAGQLQGSISRKIDAIYDSLSEITAHFHAAIDYPDEDIEPFELLSYAARLESSCMELSRLEDSFERGRIMKNGLAATIVGKPNAGKSSFLNALLGYDRAIVTDIPGTTRDTIEEKCILGGVLLRLTDTAGLRNTSDPVERAGVERARKAVREADLALAVFDGSQPLEPEDAETAAEAGQAGQAIAVINKSDLPARISLEDISGDFTAVCRVSSLDKTGLDILGREIRRIFPHPETPAGELLTNARQAGAVGRARTHLKAALSSIRAGVFPDAVLTEIEASMSCLGELLGKTVREDIVSKIFDRFCVGK